MSGQSTSDALQPRPLKSFLEEGLREVVTFHPAPGAWAAATQAAVAVTLPPAVFAVAGQLHLGLLAAMGSLIVLYLSDRSRRERAAKLPVIGAGFLVAIAVGIPTGGSILASLTAICVVAIGFSFLSLTFQIGPPGAIFPVLLTGSSGQLAASDSAGGAAMDPWLVAMMVAFGILSGYAVIVLPLLLPSVRAADAPSPHGYEWTYTFPDDAGRIFTRLTVAVVVSLATSALFGLQHIAWVLLAVIGILQRDSDLHLGTIRMLQRLLGTGLGVCAALLFRLWTPPGIVLIVVVGVLIFGFVALVRRNLMFALMMVTPVALLLVAGGDRSQLSSTTEIRVMDTVVGASVAATVLGLVALVKLLCAHVARLRAQRLSDASAAGD
jgi:hypothetical protein